MDAKDIEIYCRIDSRSQQLLEKSINRLGLSARAYHRILKLARTIADLEGHEDIAFSDVAEAVGYDMDFCCLDFIITSRTRSFRLGNWTLLMLCQAENREFEQLEDVFHAITLSLFNRPNGATS